MKRIFIWLCVLFFLPFYGQTDDWPQKVLENPERMFWVDPEMCSAALSGNYLVIGGSWTGRVNFVKIFDLNNGAISSLPEQEKAVWALIFSPDKRNIFTASGSVIVQWNLATMARIRSFAGHNSEVFGLDYGAGDFLASSGGFENIIRIWDLRWGTSKIFGAARATPYDFNPPWVGPVKFIDSYRIVSGHDDGVRIWNINNGSYVSLGRINQISAIAVSKNQKMVAAGSRDGVIMIWDITSRVLLNTINVPGGEVGSLDFSPDGAWIITARQYNIVQVLDVYTGEYLLELRHGGHSPVFFANFFEDGRIVSATGYPEGAVRVWQVGYPPRTRNILIKWSTLKGGR